MEYARLGGSDLLVSRIGFGCAAIGGYDYGPVDDGESAAAIERAVGAGINFFDVADVYGLGHAEEVLARALGPERHKVVIATKGGVGFDASGRTWLDITPAYLTRAVDESLRRLDIDCIPLYQIHKPDGVTPIADAVGALRRCQEQGKIRYLGVTRFDAAEVDQARGAGHIESIQLPLSLLERQCADLIAYCAGVHQMGAISFNSLGHGLLSGRFDATARFEGTDLRRRSELFRGDGLARGLRMVELLRRQAAIHGRTPAQVALRWTLEQPGITCVLCGIKRPSQVAENAGAAGWRLTADDMATLDAPAEIRSPLLD